MSAAWERDQDWGFLGQDGRFWEGMRSSLAGEDEEGTWEIGGLAELVVIGVGEVEGVELVGKKVGEGAVEVYKRWRGGGGRKGVIEVGKEKLDGGEFDAVAVTEGVAACIDEKRGLWLIGLWLITVRVPFEG